MAAEQVVYVRTTRAAIRAAVAAIPEAALGMHGAKTAADAMMTRMGMVALGRIKKAFITKSRGGTDEAGDRWKPLSPYTIAYGRRHPGLPAPSKRAAARPSYALTAKQRTRWWSLYSQGLAMYKGDKGRAARRAWSILRAAGATTLFDKYAHTQVDILRDTGLLLNSLSPGVPSGEQVFRLGRGEVIVGTNRKWARVHHEGSRNGRIPQRRLWPNPIRWPASWYTDILEQARAGLADIAVLLIKRGAGT